MPYAMLAAALRHAAMKAFALLRDTLPLSPSGRHCCQATAIRRQYAYYRANMTSYDTPPGAAASQLRHYDTPSY